MEQHSKSPCPCRNHTFPLRCIIKAWEVQAQQTWGYRACTGLVWAGKVCKGKANDSPIHGHYHKGPIQGPHWLTRFLRKQPEKPPTVKERLAYLEAELAKPEEERLLRIPEVDEAQRSYKQ